MSNGASMGNGIYMADSLSTPLNYANVRNHHGNWPEAAVAGGAITIVVAICEVIDRSVDVAVYILVFAAAAGPSALLLRGPLPLLLLLAIFMLFLSVLVPTPPYLSSLLLIVWRLSPFPSQTSQRGVQAERTRPRVLRCSRRRLRYSSLGAMHARDIVSYQRPSQRSYCSRRTVQLLRLSNRSRSTHFHLNVAPYNC